MTMTVLLPSRIENLWATRKRRLSKLNHTAHSLARLRIAGRSVAPDVARRATGLPCSAVTGRDLHPLDNDSAFPKMTATSFPADQPCLVAPQSVLSVNTLDCGYFGANMLTTFAQPGLRCGAPASWQRFRASGNTTACRSTCW